ncbi:uncharacterized protein QC763_201560 [Podospora pseudopauciseta]|uniref:Uncharacterized protein n=1 Tax=Podospora pseudopauciseta TaxID=2093780 RepID=A0ABR0HMW0_9PEZI|nr:hypothetical protein QC763_201560 [Podospora pseudopauciseta]
MALDDKMSPSITTTPMGSLPTLRRKLTRLVLTRGILITTVVYVFLLSLIVGVQAALPAEFTNSFDGLGEGGSVGLTWEGVKPEYFPLSITAQVIDKGEDGSGSKVTVYKVNITAAATGSSYVWTNMPHPLRWIKSGLYQLELKPSAWTDDGEAPVLARSSFFSVGNYVPPAPSPSESSSPEPSKGDKESSSGGGGVSKSVAIGVGVAIGVPSLVGLVVVGWFFRRRYKRARAEKRRLKRSEFVIY